MNIRIDDKVLDSTGIHLHIWLRYFVKQGYSGRHIARVLNISESSVRNYVKYYKLKLRYKPPVHRHWGWRGY